MVRADGAEQCVDCPEKCECMGSRHGRIILRKVRMGGNGKGDGKSWRTPVLNAQEISRISG
jgi:hypothetical protein